MAEAAQLRAFTELSLLVFAEKRRVEMAEDLTRNVATRKPILRWIGVACVVVANAVGLLAFGQIKIEMGTPPFRVQEFALLGICTGHLCLLIFAMSFGRLRGPARHALCSILVLISVWACYQGLDSIRNLFSRAGADRDILPHHQLTYLAVLWVGFVLLTPLRKFLRLEFGLIGRGAELPVRSTQFRLHAIIYFSVIVAIAGALVRILVVNWNDSNPNDQVSPPLVAVPLFAVGTLLATMLPLLFTALARRRWAIRFLIALVWAAVPIYPIELATGLYVTAFYTFCLLTVGMNVLGMRLLGFRWLSVAPSPPAVVSAP